jgi:hypothetical protein
MLDNKFNNHNIIETTSYLIDNKKENTHMFSLSTKKFTINQNNEIVENYNFANDLVNGITNVPQYVNEIGGHIPTENNFLTLEDLNKNEYIINNIQDNISLQEKLYNNIQNFYRCKEKINMNLYDENCIGIIKDFSKAGCMFIDMKSGSQLSHFFF